MKKTGILALAVVFTLQACRNKNEGFIAGGVFEALEVTISSEANGIIREFNLREGDLLKAGEVLGYVDSTQLHLRRKQLQAQIRAILGRSPDMAAQLAALEEQEKQAKREKERIAALFRDNAATQKQLDDITSQVSILQKQIEAHRSTLGISSRGVQLEADPLYIQLEQLNDQISRCRIVNPTEGTVLLKYAEMNEITAPSKPLFKIADLRTLVFRSYISGDQLSKFKTGDTVSIGIDQGDAQARRLQGRVEWISNKAEFTPKTIQTKDERANLVYAMKVNVKNDGSLKLGMYGELLEQ